MHSGMVVLEFQITAIAAPERSGCHHKQLNELENVIHTYRRLSGAGSCMSHFVSRHVIAIYLNPMMEDHDDIPTEPVCFPL